MTFHEINRLASETGLPLSDLLAMSDAELLDMFWGPDEDDDAVAEFEDFDYQPEDVPSHVLTDDLYGETASDWYEGASESDLPRAFRAPYVSDKAELGWDR